jgi:hypothetical protein
MIDVSVACVIKSLGDEMERRPYLQAEDMAIVASQCLTLCPLTIAEYWTVARTCSPRLKSLLEKAWLTPSLWHLLSDWTGRGADMAAFIHCAKASLTTARHAELSVQVARVSTWLAWSPSELQSWLSETAVELRGWTDLAIKHAHPSLYPVLLSHLVTNPKLHSSLTTKAVSLLLSRPDVTNAALCAAMSKFGFSNGEGAGLVATQEKLIISAWIEALDWAGGGVTDSFHQVRSILRGKTEAWECAMKAIVTRLAESELNPVIVESLLARLPIAPQHILSAAISVIASNLPVALSHGFVSRHMQAQHIMRWINNEAYTFSVREQWFHLYKDHIVTTPQLKYALANLTKPIGDTVALWCFIGATTDGPERIHWKDKGVDLDTRARQHNFLAKHAPQLVPLLPMLSSIGLSFGDALALLPSVYLDTQLSLPEVVCEGEAS